MLLLALTLLNHGFELLSYDLCLLQRNRNTVTVVRMLQPRFQERKVLNNIRLILLCIIIYYLFVWYTRTLLYIIQKEHMSRIHGNNGSKKVRVIMAGTVSEAPSNLVFFSSARGHSGTFFQLAARLVTRSYPPRY